MRTGVYRWNLNERRGDVSGSRISETEMDLHLGLRRVDDSIEKVGLFHLPLLSLHKDGLVGRRDTEEGNWSFSVKIVRTSDGSYSIAYKNKTAPLARMQYRPMRNAEGRV